MQFPIRINKYIRDKGLASRKEADSLIAAGKVSINGKRAEVGMMVGSGDKVEIKIGAQKNYAYLAYYKPRGLSTQGVKGETSVIAEWSKRGLFPVGRLDKESEGLMILTNDGRVTTALLGQDSKFEKEYIAGVREKLRAGLPAIFSKGMETEAHGQLLPAKAKIINDHTAGIVLIEGKRHQIRVMLSELGYTVEKLKRIRIGPIKLDNLKPGETRALEQKEIDFILPD